MERDWEVVSSVPIALSPHTPTKIAGGHTASCFFVLQSFFGLYSVAAYLKQVDAPSKKGMLFH